LLRRNITHSQSVIESRYFAFVAVPRNQKKYQPPILVPGATDSVHALRATVLSNKPAKRPSELVLALSDGHTPEVTITLRDSRENLTPLLKPIPAGTEIEFWGIPVSFTPNPFMLTFEVKAENGPAGANPRMLLKAAPKTKP
jgi:hypothetical protein